MNKVVVLKTAVVVLLLHFSCVLAVSVRNNAAAAAASAAVATTYSTITPANRTLCPENEHERPPNRVNTTQRVADLRSRMNSAAGGPVDAYLTLIADDHGTAGTSWDARVAFISGFTGSNGFTIVTATEAALWTDGRYYAQGEQQLDCSWILMRSGAPGYPTGPEWLAEVLSPGSRVGAYPNYLSISTWDSYEERLQAKNITMVPMDKDLVDIVWDNSNEPVRPAKPDEPLIVHTIEFTGVDWVTKVKNVRGKLNDADPAKRADCFIATILEDVNWLFNLRGNDRTNSLFYGYAIVCLNQSSSLYIRNVARALNTADIRQHLHLYQNGTCVNGASIDCVQLLPYGNVTSDVRDINPSFRLWIDPAASYAIYSAATEGRLENLVRKERSPIALMKAVKHPVEKEKFYDCIMRDSAAVVEFIATLEKEVKDGVHWTEMAASERMKEIRSTYEHNKGISFDTIAGSGPNGAIIHYRPESSTNADITTREMFLFDSGGQYLDGTTDVTRTFHFGTPTDEEKEAYTRVLMGSIDLATTVWPKGLYGSDIDARARVPLWQHGWDYNHGTGHGIGYFLSVHEGPGRINLGFNAELYAPLEEGMFFSDEPGFYLDGKFGVRLETLVGVELADTPNRFDGKQFLAFKPATLVPFEPNLIKYDMLSNEQIKWLNDYHKLCLDQTGKYLLEERRNQTAYDWLVKRTHPYGTVSAGSKLSIIPMLVYGILAVLPRKLYP